MTLQQQQKKASTLINLNTVVTAICTATIIWFGTEINKMRNDLLIQPKIDETQTSAILILTNRDKEQETDIKNHNERIIKLEAILPSKDQFKIK